MKQYKQFKIQLQEEACPLAVRDLHVNVKNRQHAIDEYVYGPANPNEPGDYWSRLGKIWGISPEEASTMRCHNCAAFNVSPKMKKCMADAIGPNGMAVVDQAELGYCELLQFKCAGDRSCSVWLTNGPITK